LGALRDNLWHTVDGKVAAAVAADDRAQDGWLAAAHTVTTGAGDRAAASERVNQDVKPFVANDIGAEWLTAMRSTTAAVVDLYDAATAELTGEPDAVFDVPGDLGPAWTPAPRDDEVATVPAAASPAAPSFSVSPSPSPSPSLPPAPAPSAATAGPPPVPPMPPPLDAGSTAPAMAAPPSAPSLGGMPDIGSGLTGFGQQLADTLGGLFGSTDDGPLDPPELDEPDDSDDDDPEEDDLDDAEPVEPAVDPDAEPAVDEPVEAQAALDTCDPVEPPAPVEPPPAEPIATPVPEPPLEPAPPPEPVDAETPCEIAADELPQVGE
jgi:hypothetical protein